MADYKKLYREVFEIAQRCEHAMEFFRKAQATQSTEEQKVLAGQLITYLEENPIQGITVISKAERDAIKSEAQAILDRAERILETEDTPQDPA